MALMRLLPQKHLPQRSVQECMNLILSGPVHKANKLHALELLKTCSLSADAAVTQPLGFVDQSYYPRHFQWFVDV